MMKKLCQVNQSVIIASTWLRSCTSCHIKMFDLQEELLLQAQELKVTYITMNELEHTPFVDIGIVEGAVAGQENEAMLKKLRDKSRLILAVGTCACFGDSPSLGKFFINLERSSSVSLKPLNEIIPVDYTIPGCPPPFSSIKETVFDLVKGIEPPQARKTTSLCSTCRRLTTRPLAGQDGFDREDNQVSFDSIYQASKKTPPDPEICFLEQGILCMGMVTSSGCGARCINGNIPCRGCMGSINITSHANNITSHAKPKKPALTLKIIPSVLETRELVSK